MCSMPAFVNLDDLFHTVCVVSKTGTLCQVKLCECTMEVHVSWSDYAVLLKTIDLVLGFNFRWLF